MFWASLGQAASSGKLNWDLESGKVAATLRNEPLSRVLSDISVLTGWDVMVEPGLGGSVSTRFEALPVSQALRRILGDLNFALLTGEDRRQKLYIYRNSIRSATETLRSAKAGLHLKSRRIENEIIVTLAPDSPETIEELAERLGAEVVGKIDGLSAYRLRFKDAEDAGDARIELTSVDYLEVSDNYEVDIPARLASLNFGAALMPRIRANSNPGQENVVIGLVDTPVQSIGPGLSEFLLPTVSVAGKSVPPSDEPTHGTTMAETMLRGLEMVNDGSGSSNVRILPVDVYGSEPITSTFQVAAGVVAAIDSGASIVNLSLGGQETAPFLQNIIQDAHQQGALFISAAGNEPGKHDIFPAAYPEVLAVTSSDQTGGVASYANSGNFVDVMVPGRSFVHYNGETYLIHGTSASAAYVSGITAGIAATSGLPLHEVEQQVRTSLPKPPGN
ncbi:MAG: Thermophilic serine proteinase [Verrucomicrobia subdivision 3 bacterium]|nr:Thermophilic serine proteinase [Limisphaerales bacterium]MCS1417101.1 Thermophilic serine proteinase [Limisphaerales bacterium]